jgi:chemotaxis-related protein WspD
MAKAQQRAPDSAPTIDDCWNRIGVRGDVSCPELETYIHCRNCPVHAAAGKALLDRDLPPGHLAEWTRHVAQEKPAPELGVQSGLIFRIGAEWLALPTAIFKEVVGARPLHSVPHRRNGVVLGLVNIRGELEICVSLRQILRLEADGAADPASGEPRLMVLRHEDDSAVCPVDEVFGVERYYPRQLMPVPATAAKATATYTKAVLSWRDKSVGLLDPELLFHTINRSLALATTT